MVPNVEAKAVQYTPTQRSLHKHLYQPFYQALDSLDYDAVREMVTDLSFGEIPAYLFKDNGEKLSIMSLLYGKLGGVTKPETLLSLIKEFASYVLSDDMDEKAHFDYLCRQGQSIALLGLPLLIVAAQAYKENDQNRFSYGFQRYPQSIIALIATINSFQDDAFNAAVCVASRVQSSNHFYYSTVEKQGTELALAFALATKDWDSVRAHIAAKKSYHPGWVRQAMATVDAESIPSDIKASFPVAEMAYIEEVTSGKQEVKVEAQSIDWSFRDYRGHPLSHPALKHCNPSQLEYCVTQGTTLGKHAMNYVVQHKSQPLFASVLACVATTSTQLAINHVQSMEQIINYFVNLERDIQRQWLQLIIDSALQTSDKHWIAWEIIKNSGCSNESREMIREMFSLGMSIDYLCQEQSELLKSFFKTENELAWLMQHINTGRERRKFCEHLGYQEAMSIRISKVLCPQHYALVHNQSWRLEEKSIDASDCMGRCSLMLAVAVGSYQYPCIILQKGAFEPGNVSCSK